MEIRNAMTLIQKTGLVLLVSLLLAAPAIAVDGVREINQSRVQADGGFPFTIDQPGSYRLTGDLDLPDADTTGILIQAAFVTLDLNGFAIRCSACSGSGSGDGIFADVFYSPVAVSNGTIANVGNRGVALAGLMTHVDRVRVSGAGGIGIELSERGLVTRSQSVGNAAGIRVGRGSAVLDSSASQNTGNGLSLDPFGLVAGVSANENLATGVASTEGSVIIDSTMNMNGARGLLSQEAVVTRVTAQANQANGIECSQCVVTRSIVIDNGGTGIQGDQTGIAGNVLRFNGGAQAAGFSELGGNICGSNASCP